MSSLEVIATTTTTCERLEKNKGTDERFPAVEIGVVADR